MRNIPLLLVTAIALLGAGASGAGEAQPGRPPVVMVAPGAGKGGLAPATPAPEAGVTRVVPVPLEDPAFKPFGQIIEVPAGTPPSAENAVMKYWGGLARARFHEDLEFGVIRIRARDRELAEMKRHVKSPVFLVALDCDFLLPVAPHSVPKAGKACPDAARLKVFLVKKGQAVLLSRGVWHTLPFPVAGEGLFIEAARDGTWKKDTVLRPFRGKETVKF